MGKNFSRTLERPIVRFAFEKQATARFHQRHPRRGGRRDWILRTPLRPAQDVADKPIMTRTWIPAIRAMVWRASKAAANWPKHNSPRNSTASVHQRARPNLFFRLDLKFAPLPLPFVTCRWLECCPPGASPKWRNRGAFFKRRAGL